jgi:hypothetical protein
MSNPTKKDAGQSAVLFGITIELTEDGSILLGTNIEDPVVFSRVMGQALQMKMNQFMESAARRVELAHMANTGMRLVPSKERN